MKNLISILIVTFSSITSIVTAQNVELKNGSYIQYPELTKYEGTWLWQSGDSVLTIIFVKTILNHKELNELRGKSFPEVKSDCIIGWHELVVNGKIIQSSLKQKTKNIDLKMKNQTIVAFDGGDKINISQFNDISTGAKIRGGSFRLLENGTKANLKLITGSEWKIRESENFSIPSNIIMRRKN